MKIVNLIEDTPGEEGILYEHGLSFYIETKKHRLILDTGATDAFIKNANKKGIDLTKVDTVIISHGHYDHAGGVMALARINPEAVIYINKNAVGKFYNCRDEQEKYIGMDENILALKRVTLLEGNYRIDDEISVFANVKGRHLWPKGNESLKKKCGNDFLQDEFDHEQYLVIEEGNNRVLLSGCAHNGILNILDKYRGIYKNEPTHVISGFHTVKKEYTTEDLQIIEETAKCLADTDTQFYSGHCSGEYPLEIMKEILRDKLTVIHSGDNIIN